MSVKRDLLDKTYIRRLIRRLVDEAIAAIAPLAEIDGGNA